MPLAFATIMHIDVEPGSRGRLVDDCLTGRLVGDCLTSLIWMARGDGSTVSLSAAVAGADGAGSLPRMLRLPLLRSLRKMTLA